jgi:hypothetical protein
MCDASGAGPTACLIPKSNYAILIYYAGLLNWLATLALSVAMRCLLVVSLTRMLIRISLDKQHATTLVLPLMNLIDIIGIFSGELEDNARSCADFNSSI